MSENKSSNKKRTKREKTIRKFVNIDQIVNFALDKDLRFAVWIANQTVNHAINSLKLLLDRVKELPREIPKSEIEKWLNGGHSEVINKIIEKSFGEDVFWGLVINYVDEKISYILEWIDSPIRDQEEKINISQYNIKEAEEKAKEWHDSLEATGVVLNEKGTVIMTFDDGYYWIDLESKDDADEARAMGHCGTTGEGTTLYSLRKKTFKNGKQVITPHVTMAISETSESITQLKGRENKKPIDKYHKYIVELLLKDDFVAEIFWLEYDTGDDFEIDDLSDELYNKIVSNKPSFLSSDFDIRRASDAFEKNIDKFTELELGQINKILIFAPKDAFFTKLTDHNFLSKNGDDQWSRKGYNNIQWYYVEDGRFHIRNRQEDADIIVEEVFNKFNYNSKYNKQIMFGYLGVLNLNLDYDELSKTNAYNNFKIWNVINDQYEKLLDKAQKENKESITKAFDDALSEYYNTTLKNIQDDYHQWLKEKVGIIVKFEDNGDITLSYDIKMFYHNMNYYYSSHYYGSDVDINDLPYSYFNDTSRIAQTFSSELKKHITGLYKVNDQELEKINDYIKKEIYGT